MKIAGQNKCSFSDYPGRLAAVVFTPGCNLDCFYCHNRGLIGQDSGEAPENFLAWLADRRGLVDAVVVSGGEPTLQEGLAGFLQKVRGMGFLTKLDTNGTQPDVLRELIEYRLVDYVAMDVKAPPSRYGEMTGRSGFAAAIEDSIGVLLKGRTPYEFRTTFSPPLRTPDAVAIARQIAGARKYVLQQYRPELASCALAPKQPHPDEYVREAACAAGEYVKLCDVRGLRTSGAGIVRTASAQPIAAGLELVK